jgi:SufE protein probably involved in Fe-S center assembly
MTIKEKQQELVDEFAFLEDWEQKYEYIIDLGKELKRLPEEKKPMKT